MRVCATTSPRYPMRTSHPRAPGPGLPAQRQRQWRRYLRRTLCPSRSAARRARSVSSISRTETTCAFCRAKANMYSIKRVSTRGCSSSLAPVRFAGTVCQFPPTPLLLLAYYVLRCQISRRSRRCLRARNRPNVVHRRHHAFRDTSALRAVVIGTGWQNRTPLTRGCRRSLPAQARDMSTDKVMNNVFLVFFLRPLYLSLLLRLYTLWVVFHS